MNQMSNMSGDEWKDVRSTFSPIFTSGKLKGMLRFITGVTEHLVQDFAAKAKLGTDFELKEVYGKFRQGKFVVHFIFHLLYIGEDLHEICINEN
jgi:hypothetical protein